MRNKYQSYRMVPARTVSAMGPRSGRAVGQLQKTVQMVATFPGAFL